MFPITKKETCTHFDIEMVELLNGKNALDTDIKQEEIKLKERPRMNGFDTLERKRINCVSKVRGR